MRQVSIRAWGNSLGIRIPRDILDKLGLSVSDTLELGVEDNVIILRKPFRHKTFEERLACYGGNITVEDFDWDEPMGKEIL